MVESGKLKLLAQHVVNLTYRTLNARWDVFIIIYFFLKELILSVHFFVRIVLFTVFCGGSLVRSPKVQVLKQVVATHRGLGAPGLEGAKDVAPSGLVASNSTDSLGLEDVADEEWLC